MLQLIENDTDKIRYQHILTKTLQAKAKNIGTHYIGWQGGGDNARVYLKNNFWFTSKKYTDRPKTPRYWNAFGYCDPKQPDSTTLVITVEINIELENTSNQLAGYFARDESGRIWLMHSGRVGGGRAGISKEAFLGWGFIETCPVFDAHDKTRQGIPVTPIDQSNALQTIEKFVDRVRKFKEEATSKPEILKIARNRYKERTKYRREATGVRKAKGKSAVAYETMHGDVVDALFREREANKKQYEAVLNGLPDLYVTDRGIVTEVYEVKMSCDRQSLYTAIGQLFVHSAGNIKAQKILVLPSDQKIARDIQKTIISFGIDVRRFQITDNNVRLAS